MRRAAGRPIGHRRAIRPTGYWSRPVPWSSSRAVPPGCCLNRLYCPGCRLLYQRWNRSAVRPRRRRNRPRTSPAGGCYPVLAGSPAADPAWTTATIGSPAATAESSSVVDPALAGEIASCDSPEHHKSRACRGPCREGVNGSVAPATGGWQQLGVKIARICEVVEKVGAAGCRSAREPRWRGSTSETVRRGTPGVHEHCSAHLRWCQRR